MDVEESTGQPRLDEDGRLIYKDQGLQVIWYITLPAVFNVGWSSVQLTNMSILNTLTKSNRKSDKLSNNRNGFTSLAFILVLSFALITFILIEDPII